MVPNAEDEWMTWRVICRLLRQRGIDVDAPMNDALVRAIRHYGVAYLGLFGDSDVRHPQAAQDAEQTRALFDEILTG